MRFAFLFLISFVVLFDIQAEELLEPVCIEIEQKGENASVAKKEALEIALKFALKDAIADQLNCSEKLVDGISKKQIASCLYEYVVENEKYSDSVYIAKISYKFKKKNIIAILKDLDIEVKEKITKEKEADQVRKIKKRHKLLISTSDFKNYVLGRKNFFFDIEKISKERVLIVVDNNGMEKMKDIPITYQKLKENERKKI